MSATSEQLVEQLLDLERQIAEAAHAGVNPHELEQQRDQLHKKLNETVEQLEKGQLLKG